MEKQNIQAIDSRYSKLAESQCCLSCGGAINYSDVRQGEYFLDLGSGRGTDVLRLAQDTGENGKAYGLDVSNGMLEKARKTAVRLGISNAEFIKSELEHIPLPDQHIDCVISNCTLNHASDKKAVWNEVFRVLKKGGRFVVSDIYSSEPVPAEYANDPQAIAECWAGAVTKDEYMQTLSDCGFSEISIIEESAAYEKGKIMVSSFTVQGLRPSCCCCS
ncbi:MAG: methyltransferase domain-containing protein [Spirochaetales bacterium]|nr:methyltransferase domain-containing protein [Spirochaetales bacterium]